MASFLEKIKKGMGAETEPEQEQEKPVKKQRRPKKLEIKTEPLEEKEPGIEKQEEKEAKKDKWFELEGQLAVDVYETDGELVIQTAIAGVKPEDLDISVENDRVLIKGERGQTSKEEGKNYFYQECYWGAFSREVILPTETDPGRAEASMKQGVLTIRIPKIEREKKRKIEIKG